MTFHLEYFLPAVLLLWIPLPYSPRRERSYTYRGRISNASVAGLFRAWQNWLDLVRAGGGTYLLMNLGISVDLGGSSGSFAVLVKEAILLVGLLMQTLRFGPGTQGFFAPIFYLTGVTATLQPPMIAGFSVVLAWLFLCGTREPRILLPLLGVCLMVAAYFLGGMGRTLYLNIGLIGLPMFLAVILQKRLLFVSRERVLDRVPKERLPLPPRRPDPPRGRNVSLKSRRASAAEQ